MKMEDALSIVVAYGICNLEGERALDCQDCPFGYKDTCEFPEKEIENALKILLKTDLTKKTIYRSREDLQFSNVYTKVECPYCEYSQRELDMAEHGATYDIVCDNCKQEYKMHFRLQ